MSWVTSFRGALGLAIAAAMLGTAFNAICVGVRGWDDGAITLAYSRTLAETGRIALTAASEQVEGFSSLSWMLINALVALFRPGFEGAIAIAQILAGLSLAAGLVFMALIARAVRLEPLTRLAMLMLYAVLGGSMREIGNAMEMLLLAASGLGIVYFVYYAPNRVAAGLLTLVFLTTRFEAMLYFALMMLPLLAQGRRRVFIEMAAIGFVIVALMEIWRIATFGVVFPNTVYAKMHPPYAMKGPALDMRADAMLQAITQLQPVLWVLGVVAIAAHLVGKKPAASPTADAPTYLPLVAAALGPLLFAFATGPTWGYMSRMESLSIPFLLLLAGMLFDRVIAGWNAIPRTASLALMLVAGTLHSWSITAFNPTDFALQYWYTKGNFHSDVVDLTPDQYRITGESIDRFRQLSGRETISFVTPDVGGLGLCCPRIRVIDIALLTNGTLAQKGYAAVPEVVARENPDIVQVHLEWATESKIYELPTLKADYQPMIIDRTRVFVRNELANAVGGRLCSVKDEECMALATTGHRHAQHPDPGLDKLFLASGEFRVLDTHEVLTKLSAS